MISNLSVSSSPHVKRARTTRSIMLDVVIALLPAAISGCIIFGLSALFVLVTTVAAAVLSEFVFNLIVKKEQTIGDLSAVVTGLLLGLNLHSDTPLWQCAIGSVFAIIVVKCLFGGLGCNFANPAIAARVFLIICFTSVAGGAIPLEATVPEITAGATPLMVLRSGEGTLPSIIDMLIGLRPGAIGETSIFCLIAGYIYLVARRVIKFETPLIFVATVFLFMLIYSADVTFALYHVLSGGLMIAAVFMITDYVTTPLTRSGKMIFAFGCGLITCVVRLYGDYFEGVSFAILFMNIISPYIEKWTLKIPFGKKGGRKE